MLFRRRKYKVRMSGRSGMTYEEGGRVAYIETEMLTGDIDLVIYFDNLERWQSAHENETISADEKNRIKTNIAAVLEDKGLVASWR